MYLFISISSCGHVFIEEDEEDEEEKKKGPGRGGPIDQVFFFFIFEDETTPKTYPRAKVRNRQGCGFE